MVLGADCRVMVNMMMMMMWQVTYSRTRRSWGSSLTGHTLDRKRDHECLHLIFNLIRYLSQSYLSRYLLSGLASLTNGTLGSWKTLESRTSSRSLLSSLTRRTLIVSKRRTVRVNWKWPEQCPCAGLSMLWRKTTGLMRGAATEPCVSVCFTYSWSSGTWSTNITVLSGGTLGRK